MKLQNTGLIVKSKLTEKYTIIPNAILNDQKLSLKSKGLLCILLSLPSDWAVYKSQLQTFSTDGRDGTIASFNELVDNGYITAIRRHNSKGQFMGWDYVVYNERVEPITETPITENPKTVNPSLQSTNELSTNIQNTNTRTSNTSIGKKSISTLRGEICIGMNITSSQLNDYIENNFSTYGDKLLLEQYSNLIKEYKKQSQHLIN
jgi:hypothetical protein